MQPGNGDITKYFAQFSSSDLGSIYTNTADTKPASRSGPRRASLGGGNEAQDELRGFKFNDSRPSFPLGRVHDEHAYQLRQTLSQCKSQSYGPATTASAAVKFPWKTSSSSRRTDASSDELAASTDDMDDFVKMDTTLQLNLLNCKSPEDKVQLYKKYVCELLNELVMTETHSEELEYELGLRHETIEQQRQKIEDLTALEKFQTLREFEDSANFDLYNRGSQGEVRALFRKQEAEVRIFRERATAAEDEQVMLREKLAAMEHELSKFTMTNRQLQTDLQNEKKRREESDKKASMLREKVDTMRRSPQKAKPSEEETQRLQEALEHATRLETMVQDQQRVVDDYEAQVAALTRQLREQERRVEDDVMGYRTALANKDGEIRCVNAAWEAHLEGLELKYRQSEVTRRKLHNQVMELKGNVRVFCRVRPVLPSERAFGRKIPEIYLFPDNDKEKRQVVLVDPKAHSSYMQQSSKGNNQDSGGKQWPFEFDQVFDWHASQEEMFEEVAALVQSAVDGYNVSIFAYGQSGSGKTYTMQGDERALAEHSPSQWMQIPDLGIVGRTMAHIFATCEKQRDHGWTYEIRFEMYEIHNNKIIDLMSNASTTDSDHKIHKDADGTVHISNLILVDVQDEHHAMQLLKKANSRRSVNVTNLNEHSSRSHSITTLRLIGRHEKTSSVRKGAVYLIDLAGSENLNKSGSIDKPDTLKETQHINSSLSALGNVISAIASKKSHVPFRDSKLTMVLQNSLGRDSKTLVICTLSPLEDHRLESLNTLRFAKKANTCELAVQSK
ncbi:Aste57867_23041 [Aphanomyces stellatus]|uniref:Aste57867_23041 protein n=1 Tax=Aphanomyces stellatus TaxID=120398 RepID=A0A485LLN9_9STRA|nr:hypothetical protein As57867_022970 [Aphanomyces stellatus]VFT99689.1 Aste57867_23041 [Aphanomyces stellatus]